MEANFVFEQSDRSVAALGQPTTFTANYENHCLLVGRSDFQQREKKQSSTKLLGNPEAAQDTREIQYHKEYA